MQDVKLITCLVACRVGDMIVLDAPFPINYAYKVCMFQSSYKLIVYPNNIINHLKYERKLYLTHTHRSPRVGRMLSISMIYSSFLYILF